MAAQLQNKQTATDVRCGFDVRLLCVTAKGLALAWVCDHLLSLKTWRRWILIMVQSAAFSRDMKGPNERMSCAHVRTLSARYVFLLTSKLMFSPFTSLETRRPLISHSASHGIKIQHMMYIHIDV